MSDVPYALIVSLLDWVADGPRPYSEMLEAWRTSCPRLTVWEEAFDRGLICRECDEHGEPTIALTAEGRALVRSRRGD